MMAVVTYSPQGDRGDLERIYDRLRKRSYRKWGGLRRNRDERLYHEAYVEGVREALVHVKEAWTI